MENATYIARTSGIGTRDKIGYMMGDLGSLLVFGLVQSVLQKYYTDVLGITPWAIMIMFVVARVWDAINDPIWGRIVDGMPARADGRYRHWLKVLAVPTAIGAILMFVKIPGLSQGGYLAYAYVTYILFGMLYTGINIPYGSMAQVITSDERERSSLSVFRSIGSVIGALPAMVLISMCYVKLADGTRVMSYNKILIGVVVIAVLCVLAFLLSYKWTTERVKTKPAPKQKGQTWRVFKVLVRSRPFVAVCIVGMLYLAAQMFSQSYYNYLFHYYFNAPGLSLLPQVCIYLPVAVVMFFAGKLGAKLGRRELCAYGILFSGLCNLALYFLGTQSVWIFLGALFLSGIGGAFIFLLLWAIATDAIDYNAVKFGLHDEATSYAVFTFMRKLGQTVAAILTNAALIRIGYDGATVAAENLTDAVLRQMYNDSVLIPAVLYLMMFVVLLFVYPLGKKKIAELQVEKENVLKHLSEA